MNQIGAVDTVFRKFSLSPYGLKFRKFSLPSLTNSKIYSQRQDQKTQPPKQCRRIGGNAKLSKHSFQKHELFTQNPP
jgi:hypothetical protein